MLYSAALCTCNICCIVLRCAPVIPGCLPHQYFSSAMCDKTAMAHKHACQRATLPTSDGATATAACPPDVDACGSCCLRRAKAVACPAAVACSTRGNTQAGVKPTYHLHKHTWRHYTASPDLSTRVWQLTRQDFMQQLALCKLPARPASAIAALV
ncbi:hypothetical protein COO60DRAFT_30053 [Scenedesmus sp. NREL 46B-D3]|nr:hypothetical protein COO60DRAFT_30053 [Scenedesmus sp. NREL 46B-D3]